MRYYKFYGPFFSSYKSSMPNLAFHFVVMFYDWCDYCSFSAVVWHLPQHLSDYLIKDFLKINAILCKVNYSVTFAIKLFNSYLSDPVFCLPFLNLFYNMLFKTNIMTWGTFGNECLFFFSNLLKVFHEYIFVTLSETKFLFQHHLKNAINNIHEFDIPEQFVCVSSGIAKLLCVQPSLSINWLTVIIHFF